MNIQCKVEEVISANWRSLLTFHLLFHENQFAFDEQRNFSFYFIHCLRRNFLAGTPLTGK